MSTVLADPEADRAAAVSQPRRYTSLSPNQRAWARFRRNRLGYVSLFVLAAMLAVSLLAEGFSNDRPLVARYNGEWYFPIFNNPPETTFGGDFATSTEWLDPLIQEQFGKPGNFALHTVNKFGVNTLDYYARAADPAAPGMGHWLGTDQAGRDMVARLLYGFRTSVFFGLALTFVGTVLGILIGALQGYFGGRVDLTWQRVIEVWNAVPELYLLIIIASIFAPSLLLLIGVFALFGWIGLSDYVRAEFLRNRNLEFVKAARAMGLSNGQIMWRHILPNSMTPVITFLPFRMSAAIVFLTALDFLGLGVPDTASLGDLLRQGKDNLDAWWITIPTFLLLTLLFLLLTFVGDALRDAFDTRKS
ncbi:MAG TPA: ABC transporter permease [Casimicrobiaceae bacterium]|nr:ABC transporter permease [Casimicrobiaceae bacterium]